MNAGDKPAGAATRSRLTTRFDHADEDPRAGLVNLVDVMLVFACGLLAAITATTGAKPAPATEVSKGQEIAAPASGQRAAANGYQAVGQVFRDPVSGKLILVETRDAGVRPDE